MLLTPEEARYAYASMINTLDVSWIDHLLAEDFIYGADLRAFHSKKLASRQLFLEFITATLDAVRAIPCRTLWATLGSIKRSSWADPCVILSWGEEGNYVAAVTLQTAGEKITRIEFCELPDPQRVRPFSSYASASYSEESEAIREQLRATRPKDWCNEGVLF